MAAAAAAAPAASGAGAGTELEDTGASSGAYQDALKAVNNIRTRMSKAHEVANTELPQCVIAGDQSSGKSSLLEAYSGVTLPFGSGTKTRCPTEIDMHPLPHGAKREQRLFKVQDVEVKPEDLISAIEAAQAAILSEGHEGDEAEEFSSTAIRVHASTEFPQRLTILDMPGMHAKRDEGSETAKRMLEEQIASDRSLIIAVGEAGTDEARHTSFQLARDVDPEGQRTIQVFTKCDVTDGDEANRLLSERIAAAAAQRRSQGPTARFAPHFVIARLGGSAEGWSHKAEMAVFRDKLKLPRDLLKSGVVGVRSLRERTETLLRDIVLQNVPKMLAEVVAHRKRLQRELEAIGTSPAPNSSILREAVDKCKDAISELGRRTCKITEDFDALAKRISDAHAGAEDAVREEVERRMSPHEIPWFLGKYAFEKQLKAIGTDFGRALALHADNLLEEIRPCVMEGIVATCTKEAMLAPAFRKGLQLRCREALEGAEQRLRADFAELARDHSGFFTRNAHYIDGSDTTDADLRTQAELLTAALAGVATPVTTDHLLNALRFVQSTRRPRSIQDQVVARVMGDLARVAKAQLKEFLSAVNAIVKKQIVERLMDWAGTLLGDTELRTKATESLSRQHSRETLVAKLEIAVDNERDLNGLGLMDPTMPAHMDDDEDEAAGMARDAATGASAAAMEELAASLPAATRPPRSKAEFSEMILRTLGQLADKQQAGTMAWTSIAMLAAGLDIKDVEQTAFGSAIAELTHEVPTGGTKQPDTCYRSAFKGGEPALGMRRRQPQAAIRRV